MSLKRDGVRIWLGNDVERLSFEGFFTPSSFVYCVNYIGCLHKNIARSSGIARSSEGLVNVAWVVLLRNGNMGARERGQFIPHVHFEVPFLGPESHLESGFACAGHIYICVCVCKKRVCIYIYATTPRPTLSDWKSYAQTCHSWACASVLHKRKP